MTIAARQVLEEDSLHCNKDHSHAFGSVVDDVAVVESVYPPHGWDLL